MITLYSKPACVQCTATKKALDKTDISYNVIDISQDNDVRDLVLELGYTSVPVVVSGDKHWSGFRPDLLSQLK